MLTAQRALTSLSHAPDLITLLVYGGQHEQLVRLLPKVRSGLDYRPWIVTKTRALK